MKEKYFKLIILFSDIYKDKVHEMIYFRCVLPMKEKKMALSMSRGRRISTCIVIKVGCTSNWKASIPYLKIHPSNY